ncbi:magnesium chelatase, subunit ChlI domain protein, partial [Selenomonas sp. FOBRC6]|uniref:ATP-binding protein n=1 Tax=Selenomonas sp. FOBRC6 TaxID=936572 RepID=UPI000277F043
IPRPGEVTLAHHGVLFLDELPEFSKKTSEVLHEPIEDRQITVSRANATLTFPSSIILAAAMNEVTSITIQCRDERRPA